MDNWEISCMFATNLNYITMRIILKGLIIGCIVVVVMFLLTSAFIKATDGSSEADSDPSIVRSDLPLGNRGVWTVKHDGCEYIYVRRYSSIEFLHKENCKFCRIRDLSRDYR